jgi:hypothetical protein
MNWVNKDDQSQLTCRHGKWKVICNKCFMFAFITNMILACVASFLILELVFHFAK